MCFLRERRARFAREGIAPSPKTSAFEERRKSKSILIQALSDFLAETQRRGGAEENVLFEGAEGALRAGGGSPYLFSREGAKCFLNS
jgi:hypothetical protein